MLQKMLSLIHSGQFQTIQNLANTLQVSSGLVIVMAENLVQRGFLKPISSCVDEFSDNSSCQDCSTVSGCLMSGTRQGWILTEQGERFLQPSFP